MYFYDLGITQHVIDLQPPTEGPEGIYTVSVISAGKDPVSCSLANRNEPVHGPHNTVTVSCTSPSVTAISENAVIVVTGPPE